MVAPQRQLATIAARKSAPSAGYSANANPEDDTEGTVRPAFQSTRMPEERSLFVCTLSRTHSPLPATSITFSRDPFLLAHVAHVNGRAANAARHQGCAETRGETFISIHPDITFPLSKTHSSRPFSVHSTVFSFSFSFSFSRDPFLLAPVTAVGGCTAKTACHQGCPEKCAGSGVARHKRQLRG